MVIYIILILLVLALMREKRKKSEEVEGSKNFYLSDGASKAVYLQMHKDGVRGEALKKFVQLEDQFLTIEQISVSTGIPDMIQAGLISNTIKESFPKYNFSYHTTHLKKISRSI
jgi:hypothetical protein